MTKPAKHDVTEPANPCTCGQCRYFVPVDNQLPRNGQCHRNPPTTTIVINEQHPKGVLQTVWTWVNGGEWCGEWCRKADAVNAN
jgi:hypothetical protein